MLRFDLNQVDLFVISSKNLKNAIQYFDLYAGDITAYKFYKYI